MSDTETAVREMCGRMLGYYIADVELSRRRGNEPMRRRRHGQAVAVAEVLRFLDGDLTMFNQLEPYVPLTLDEVEVRFGGRAEEAT